MKWRGRIPWWCCVLLVAACRPAASDPAALGRQAEAELAAARDTGDLRHLAAAEAAVAQLARLSPDGPGTLAMRGRLAMAQHRFGAARDDARALLARAPDNGFAHAALGDALYELGEYTEAAAAWARMESISPHTAGGEMRAALWSLLHGQVGAAKEQLGDALQLVAGDGTPPGAVAACAVQLGEAEIRSGDWAGAEREYARALQVFPGHYGATEHLAELRGAQNRVDEALALYRGLVEATQRPEPMQAIGDLLAFAGRATEAAPWLARAREGYNASVARGEWLYQHHLAGLYADSLNEPGPAVAWAQKDLAQRHTIQAYDALAWALAKAGRAAEAADCAARALATGTRDPHLLYHAAMIRNGVGDLAGGRELLRRAAESNPRFNAFHVHR